MSRLKGILGVGAVACLLLVGRGARAEEIEHKWRLSVGVGGYSITDQAHSGSANVRTLLNPDGSFNPNVIIDPRNDQGAFSDFGLEPQYGANLNASYGINRFWYVEGSVGYRRGNVGNVQIQAFFDGAPFTAENPNNYAIYEINAGTITQIPIQISTGVRFRPKAAFNPYLFVGAGYSYNSFKPSAALNDLSLSLDNSIGAFALLAGPTLQPPPDSAFHSLSGVIVDAPSEPEWHFGGGLEYTFKRHWSAFVDARYSVYSGRFHLTVNGSDELGISVPNDQAVITSPGALGPFGGYKIKSGGLIDGGSLVPAPGQPPDTDCKIASNSSKCTFTGPPDGIKDTGFYYVSAGRVRYDNASFQIGIKFTF